MNEEINPKVGALIYFIIGVISMGMSQYLEPSPLTNLMWWLALGAFGIAVITFVSSLFE